jgi:hypothetical protein
VLLLLLLPPLLVLLSAALLPAWQHCLCSSVSSINKPLQYRLLRRLLP